MEIVDKRLQKIYDTLESKKAKKYAKAYANSEILAKKLVKEKFAEIRSKKPLDSRFSLFNLEAENRKDNASAVFGLIETLGDERAFEVMNEISRELIVWHEFIVRDVK